MQTKNNGKVIKKLRKSGMVFEGADRYPMQFGVEEEIYTEQLKSQIIGEEKEDAKS